MAKKEIEHTSTTLGNQDMKSSQRMVSVVEPYELPEGWKWDLAKNLAEIYTGNSINEKVKQEKYLGQTEGLNFIATKDIDFDGTIKYENGVKINDHEKFKIAPKNTPLLCIEGGSAGRKLGFSVEDVCFGNKLCAFVCKNINPKLLYFYLQSNFFYHCFMKERHGLIGGVSVNTLKQIPFPLPPTLAEQQRIVNRIESMFAKLDEAKEKAQNVVDGFETRKAAILHKAFTGELTAKWRKENGVSDDSWVEKTIGECCTVVRGGSPRPAGDPKYYDGTIPFMKVADITGNDSKYVCSTQFTIKEAGLHKTRMVEPDTLLLTNSGATLGVPAITKIKTTFNDGIAAFLNLPRESNLYFYYFFTSKTTELRAINMGAAQPNLNIDIIKSITISVPTLPEQQEIVRILDSVLEKENKAKQAAESVLEQIDLLKKSILARAFRGEL